MLTGKTARKIRLGEHPSYAYMTSAQILQTSSSQGFIFKFMCLEKAVSFPIGNSPYSVPRESPSLCWRIKNRAIRALVAAGYQSINYALHQQVQKYSSCLRQRKKPVLKAHQVASHHPTAPNICINYSFSKLSQPQNRFMLKD